MKYFLFVLSLLAIPSLAHAQVEPIVSRDIGFFLAGVDPASGGQPFQAPTNYSLAQTTCGQAKITVAGKVINPSTDVRFDDPADGTKDCVLAASGPTLASLPFGSDYKAAARALGATKTSPWSALSNPFDRATLSPATPTGVRVR